MIDLVVLAKIPAADGVVVLDLAAAHGGSLPAWRPGAHIDLVLPTADERQYSLCGPLAAGTWRIAVRRAEAGRGGSAYVHNVLEPGMSLRARGPVSHFEFRPEVPALFVAGGIGITPILPMIEAAEASGTPWRLVYAGRTRASMPFAEELVRRHPGKVELRVSAEGARLDPGRLLEVPVAGTVVYCCGPAGLMDDVEAAMRAWPRGSLCIERFAPKTVPVQADVAFEVEFALSGEVLSVPPGKSILDVAEDAGVLVLSSCREGTCGTCETAILDGTAEHRDSILSEDEQTANRTMMICVSRSRGGKLVLDL
ncbi:phthalate 4,5-dioxygenase reductase subunit [Amycolatopsis mediterranei S699]|uniref:Phthalate 4,5-dioxygenase reductase subunit n=2 Tax=Amycolatopsis mediterranei TaxID=33910 RepID=A0A0H3CYV8_AMYMU|nr:PDR/VanB family oxidoreductase [Amycolatopsis mediterranei]ADJ43807.1 phthalate 4,5-dioxygenase reductase subunit [Amycolatopsis mediterranei U32]AEK40518.1 phthalate 4,5-dioxygenase reductase subunit [Amycolatopsis mediterranei S699]AFO75520.1 phthalate 4,5-dioxygenase reductase subunit [Amycolatopsis mediterranei S699]AGT82649.1 phthalate 4,5-dioxygenase reductase subunit [Amycolatopsis mediterranei RB]KDO09186.1 ferredoxin [Amycolatopsis mediterranei]